MNCYSKSTPGAERWLRCLPRIRLIILAGVVVATALAMTSAAKPEVASAHGGASKAIEAPWRAGTPLIVGGPWGHFYGEGAHRNYGGRWGDDSHAVDIGLPGSDDVGLPLVAPFEGTVQIAGYNSLYGHTVVIEAPDGLAVRLAHLQGISVAAGQRVGAGQQVGTLGYSGQPGNPSNAHLHLALYAGRGANAGVDPSPMAGQPVYDGARITSRTGQVDNRPRFDDVRVYSSDTLEVTAGDSVTAVVSARYLGPVPMPCGHANLGVRGDGAARFGDWRKGWWPNSPFRSSNRVAAHGCAGNGYLDPGERGEWHVPFYVSEDTAPGDVLTGVWAPVHEGRAWSALEIPIVLRIGSAYRASVVDQRVTPLTEPGTTGEIMFAFENNGRATWERDEVKLATKGDEAFPWADGSWGGNRNRVTMEEESVSPGGVAHFRANIAAGAGPQSERLKQYVHLVLEGKFHFAEEVRAYQTVFVGDKDHVPYEAGDYDAKVRDQTYAEPLERGDQTNVTVTLQNTGSAVWFANGENPVHLRAHRPEDRVSPFIDTDASEALNGQGVRLPEDRVDPGESVEINVPVKVRDDQPLGESKEYFRLVSEGITWFGEPGIYWPFEIRQ